VGLKQLSFSCGLSVNISSNGTTKKSCSSGVHTFLKRDLPSLRSHCVISSMIGGMWLSCKVDPFYSAVRRNTSSSSTPQVRGDHNNTKGQQEKSQRETASHTTEKASSGKYRSQPLGFTICEPPAVDDGIGLDTTKAKGSTAGTFPKVSFKTGPSGRPGLER
jgi:hypothetical protein